MINVRTKTDPIWFGDYPESMKTKLGKRLPSFTKDEEKLMRGSADFIGLNHYFSLVAAASDSGLADAAVSYDPSWNITYMGW